MTYEDPGLVRSEPVVPGQRERGLLEVSLDAIVMIDANGRVIELNPSAQRMFGYPREQAVGRLLEERSFRPRCASDTSSPSPPMPPAASSACSAVAWR